MCDNTSSDAAAGLTQQRKIEKMYPQQFPEKLKEEHDGCTLKQENEEKNNDNMMYEIIKEELERKQEQYMEEVKAKQQLELTVQSLQMELKTLRNTQNQDFHNHEKMRDLMHENGILKRDIAILRQEIDTIKKDNLEKENKYFKNIKIIKETNAELEKSIKFNEEVATKAVSQYQQQLNDLKAENTRLNSKLEKKKENKKRLEAKIESCGCRLAAAVSEHNQKVNTEGDLTLSSQRTQDVSVQIKLSDMSELKDEDEFLTEQLSKMRITFKTLKDEFQKTRDTLRKKTLALETVQKDLCQTEQQLKKMKEMYQNAGVKVNKSAGKRNYIEDKIHELEHENLCLQQKLDDAHQKGNNRKTVINIKGGFIENGKEGFLLEEKNKLMNKCNHLKESLFQYEKEKAERKVMVRQLQQELADSLKKLTTSELPLEGTSCCHINLDETQTSKRKLFQVESQSEEEKEELRKLSELICQKYNVDQIRKKNEVEKERTGYKKFLEMTKYMLNDFGNEELGFHGDLTDQLEMDILIKKLKHKFDDLTEELGAVSSKWLYLSKNNQVIQQELSSMKEVQKKCEKTEEVNKTLEQEVVNLKTRMEKNMVELGKAEEYKLQLEETAKQEIEKLEEINLQKQAEYEKQLEQLKKNNTASANKIDLIQKNVKYKFSKMKTAYKEVTTELEEYKEAFAVSLKANRSMSKKLKKSDEIIAMISSRFHISNT
ncbi:ankyrin repeat domain-containing protein 18B-like [Saimiri boliviensis]|uniref:ankyrin repeat domain-containing protein 18B-like n=1 Tax=Saimiri boliviensis TaxID=27679 RepID=UPI003D77758F